MLAGFADSTPFCLFVSQVEGTALCRVTTRLLTDVTEGLCVHGSDILMSIFPASTVVLSVAFGHAGGAPEIGTFG